MSWGYQGVFRQWGEETDMSTETQTGSPITELSLLAAQIDEAVGGAFGDSELNSDGAWKYRFQTDSAWGIVAAGPNKRAETTYPGWGTITVEPDHCAVFFDSDLAAIVSPHGGRIGGNAVAARDKHVSELEDAMLGAFRTEHDTLTSATNEWTPALASRTEV
jgi:hypothetical protein